MEKIDLIKSYESDFDERMEEVDEVDCHYTNDEWVDVEEDEFYDLDDL